jgi:hypothetical protein
VGLDGDRTWRHNCCSVLAKLRWRSGPQASAPPLWPWRGDGGLRSTLANCYLAQLLKVHNFIAKKTALPENKMFDYLCGTETRESHMLARE